MQSIYEIDNAARERAAGRPLPIMDNFSDANDTVLVYRIENSVDGQGPYSGDFHGDKEDRSALTRYAATMLAFRDLDGAHPGPGPDGLRMFMYGLHYSGFRSWARLRDWFGVAGETGYEALHDAGYHAAVYRVSKHDVWYGGRQLAFLKDTAELIETYLLTELPE